MSADAEFMARALDLAEKGRYSVSPNPMVGCVLVREGRVIGEGYHQRAGLPHAEIEALHAATEDPSGATAYITLEPCRHYGRTPPCTASLLEAGVRRVVIATIDPNPLIHGQGIERLRRGGLEVETGVLEERARRLNEKFLHSFSRRLPFILLKAGITLDGKLATISRQSQWITSEEARRRSIELREEYDAVLVGSGTVVTDNPRLTRRAGLNSSIVPWQRVIVDTRGRIPPSAALLSDDQPTLLFTCSAASYMEAKNTEVVPIDPVEGRVPLEEVFRQLHERGIQSVLVEGGGGVHSEIIRQRLWQKMVLFVAPKLIGGAESPSILQGPGVEELTAAYSFRFDAIEKIGPDLMLTAYPD